MHPTPRSESRNYIIYSKWYVAYHVPSQFSFFQLHSYYFSLSLITVIILKLQISYFDTIKFQSHFSVIVYIPKIDFFALIRLCHNATDISGRNKSDVFKGDEYGFRKVIVYLVHPNTILEVRCIYYNVIIFVFIN